MNNFKTAISNDPMKNVVQAFLLLSSVIPAFSQSPPIAWQRSLGGTAGDFATSIIQTQNGSYLTAGYSFSIDGQVRGHHGGENIADYWVAGLDGDGHPLFQKSLGGTGHDYAYSVIQANDGNYLVAGVANSSDGDVSGNHGMGDYWIVKLDQQGQILWQKSLGGSGPDYAYDIKQTKEGGFIIAGFSQSTDGDVTFNHGNSDYWIVKTDGTGNIEWQHSFGGSSQDVAFSIQQTTDGGYVATGLSYSNDGDITDHHGTTGYTDCWIIKLDSTGDLNWQKSLGGSDYDDSHSIVQSDDGGCVIAASTYSNDGDVDKKHGGQEVWVVKLDLNGAIQWQQSLGGSKDDNSSCIQKGNNGGYIISATTLSHNGDVTGHTHVADYWISRLDNNGDLVWQEAIGGELSDYATFIQPAADGGFIIAGYSSSIKGDVTGHHGNNSTPDYWIVKLEPEQHILFGEEKYSVSTEQFNELKLFPNPTTGNLNVAIYLSDEGDNENGVTQDEAVTIFVADPLGRIIYSEKATACNKALKKQIQLNISEVNGLYSLILKTTDHVYQKPFVVQRGD